jgi:type I restriction enzyme M protein
MTTSKQDQQDELFKTIWQVATDLRNQFDGWDFKNYILGMLFYRFISENLTYYLNGLAKKAGDSNYDYAKETDKNAEIRRDQTVQEKGFYILPSELFQNVVENSPSDLNLNETLQNVFQNIELSAKGTNSENNMKGLFKDIDVNSDALGREVIERNQALRNILFAIRDFELGNFRDSTIDIFGDTYEYLMSKYAKEAGKQSGEFFTPQEVGELLAKITLIDNSKPKRPNKTIVNKVYDPACGSGSLLLKFAKILGPDNVRKGFFGQEISITNYNLCRINMFLHDINFTKFKIANGDTLLNPIRWDDEPFEAIVSNPPYSRKWKPDSKPTLKDDPRFSPAGVLAPKARSDFAFVMHILSYLANNGTAAIVELKGVLSRGGAEAKIRQYLVSHNFVDAVIQLPNKLFFGTPVDPCIIVMKKSKSDDTILFIDATAEFVHPRGKQNELSPANIEKILETLRKRKSIQYFAQLANIDTIAKNDYNLSVSNYVETEDTRKPVDIKKLNAELKQIVARENRLRSEIDLLVEEIENENEPT